MKIETLVYEADGLTMRSELYVGSDVTGPRPAVLVFPEAFGLGDHARESARRLAELGFVALACDLHGGQKIITDFPELMAVMGPLRESAPSIRARSLGALDVLLNQPEVDKSRIAAIGYCFGGSMALELARAGADIRAVVGFHSGLTTPDPEGARQVKAKILICIGADDPQVDATARSAFEEEMRARKVDWRMSIYGNVTHSFTNPAADSFGMPEVFRYDAAADARSWKEMRDFFDEVL